jgi:hypothetical protein
MEIVQTVGLSAEMVGSSGVSDEKGTRDPRRGCTL